MTRYLLISSFLNFVAAGVLALAVVVRGRKDAINVRFGVFAVIIGGWSAGYFLWQNAEEPTRALFLTRLLMLFAYFVPATFFHFVVELCGERRRFLVRAGYVLAGAFSVLNFTPLMVARVAPSGSHAFWPRAGGFYWLFLATFVAQMIWATVLLVVTLRRSSGGRETQLKNILIACVIGFSGGATNFPLWYDVPIQPVGNMLIFVYLLIMAHAVSRYQLALVTYDFVHAALYICFSVTIAVVYLLVLTSLAPFLRIQVTTELLLTSCLLCVLVCLAFFWAVPRLSRFAKLILAQTYLRRRSSQQEALRSLVQRIVSLGSEQEVFENSAAEVVRAFNLEAAAVYARTEFSPAYQLRGVQGWSRPPAELPNSPLLTRAFARRRAPLIFDGSEMEFGEEVVAELEDFRESLRVEAIFPIASDDFLSGVMMLGPRSGGDRYTEGEIALLESICLQIAVTLRARQLERRASQADKLISLGTMAAGLAHELRNPLTSIRTFSALLKENHGDTEALREFSGVVLRDVDRIAHIVENVAAFAESNKFEMGPVIVPDVVRTVREIVRVEIERGGVAWTMPEVSTPPVEGNHSQLLQVFVNLVQNALQAMDGRTGGRIDVGFDVRTRDLPQPLLTVSISDNGPGIDPQLLPHIFEPFTTTKATGQRRGRVGMGLGLAIVKRLVQHHHGEIDVASEVGQGTTFRIHLPILT